MMKLELIGEFACDIVMANQRIGGLDEQVVVIGNGKLFFRIAIRVERRTADARRSSNRRSETRQQISWMISAQAACASAAAPCTQMTRSVPTATGSDRKTSATRAETSRKPPGPLFR